MFNGYHFIISKYSKFEIKVIIKYDNYKIIILFKVLKWKKKNHFKSKIDNESPNRNIVPITTSIGSDGKLTIGGCSIEELVQSMILHYIY